MWEAWVHTARVCEPNASALPPMSALGDTWGLSDHLSPSWQPWFTGEKIKRLREIYFLAKVTQQDSELSWQGGYLELLKLGSHIFPSHPRNFQTKDRAAPPTATPLFALWTSCLVSSLVAQAPEMRDSILLVR